MTSLSFLNDLYNQSKFEEVISEAEKIKTIQLDLDIEVIIARSFRKLGKYEDALKILKTIDFIPEDSVLSKLNYYTTELDVLTHMGNYEVGQSRVDSINSLLTEIKMENLKEKDKQTVALAYNELARLCFFLSDYQKALGYPEQELAIANELNDKEKAASTLQNIGSTHTSLGQYVKAGDYLMKALSIAEEINSPHLISHISDNIGLLYFLQGKLEEALNYLEESLEINERIKDPRGMGFNYEYMGSVKLKQNQIPEALVNFEKSYEIRKSLGNDTHIASTLFAIITTFMELDEGENAEFYLNELKTVSICTKTHRNDMLYQLANAVYLKGSTIFRNKAKAEQLLKTVISNPDKADFIYTINAYLHLIDLLYEQIQELELNESDSLTTDMEELFKEIGEYS